MKKIFGIVFGVIIVLTGLILGLNSLGIADINISFDGWWTLFIIVPGITGLFENKDKTGSLIFLLIGIYLLLASRGIIEYGLIWKLFIPVCIILIGVKMIVKSIKNKF